MHEKAILEALRHWLETIRKAHKEYFEFTGEEYQEIAQYEKLLATAIDLIEYQQAHIEALVEDTWCLRHTLEDNKFLKVENERLTKELETVRGAFLEICDLRSDISKELQKTRKELNQCKKDLLKSKKYKFVRNPNRIYSIMDFEDGEILEFEDFPDNSVAIANGYAMFKGKEDTRLVNFDEVEEMVGDNK